MASTKKTYSGWVGDWLKKHPNDMKGAHKHAKKMKAAGRVKPAPKKKGTSTRKKSAPRKTSTKRKSPAKKKTSTKRKPSKPRSKASGRIPAKLMKAEDKWFRNMNQNVPYMLRQIRSGTSVDKMVKSIADLTGLSPTTVRKSFPVQNWVAAGKRLTESEIRKGIKRAHQDRSWAKGYRGAYGRTK